MSSVAVIGAGAWGTALAIQAARAGNSVTLWARDPARAAAIAASRENPRLPGMRLPDADRGVVRIASAADLALLAVPTQHLRGVARAPAPGLAPLVVCAKGVEQERCACRWRSSPDAAGRRRPPSSPGRTLPTRSPPDCRPPLSSPPPTPPCAKRSPRLLGTPSFRLYGNDDPIGAQVGGAAKNVIAIAAGAVIGAGLGENARAALITRGLAELARLAVALGGRRGDGDGPVGPRRSAADLHRRGQPQLQPRPGAGARRALADVLAARSSVTEGVATAPALVARAARRGYADLRRAVARCWRVARRWPRRSPPCWPGRGGTNDARSVLTVGGWTMASRILGFARDMLIAAMLGAGPIADAFFVALKLPNLFRRLFGEGAFNAAFVPAFSGLLAAEGPPAARQFADRDVRRDGVLARRADHRRRGVHAADDGGAGARLRRHPGEIRARGGAVAHHVPLPAADLPRGTGVGRAERARPVHRGVGVLRAVQRGLDRLHAVADALRADGRPRAGLGRHRIGRGAAWRCCCGRCVAPACGWRCRALA